MQGDVVVVGGGPAGITTALALAAHAPESKARLVVLEKARYPREKFCAGALGARGDRLLAELDAVPKVPSVPVDGISFRGARAEVSAAPGAIGRVVRRIEFDHALAEIARARGVRVEDGVRVERIEKDGRGARVVTSRGEIDARVVVGADGVGSVVRKAMGLGAGTLRAQVLEVDTDPVENDHPRTLLHFDGSDPKLPGYTWDFPTLVGGKELVCRGIYRLKVGAEDGGGEEDIQEMLGARLARMGLDLASYKNKRYAERGFEPIDRVVTAPLMLVGEAAGIDPVTGEGIAQAIEFGTLAGRFVADVLAGRAIVEDWARVLDRSRLARDLRIRRRVVPLFYGPHREAVDRFITGSPEFMHVGSQHFAAAPYDKKKLAKMALRAAGLWALAAVKR